MDRLTAEVNVAYPSHLIAALEVLDRTLFGETGYRVFQSDNIPNFLMIEFDWTNLADARKFWNSKQGEDHISSWHSVTPLNPPKWSHWLGMP